MNSPKEVAAARDGVYVILGASGNTGSIIADFLLSKVQRVQRCLARRGDYSAFCAKAPMV